jgi:TrpR-related protein YerC/YecD
MNTNDWKTPDTAKLFEAILALKNQKECEMFFRDLLTLAEIKEFANRYRVARMLAKGDKSYLTIAKEARTTTATVTRVAQWLKSGSGGYLTLINRLNHHQSHSSTQRGRVS